jgi:hypothetical protein
MSKRSLTPDSTWTIPLLKDELRKRKLLLTGNKQDLLLRLQSFSPRTSPHTSPARTSPARTSPARTSPARTSPARTSHHTSPARTSPARLLSLPNDMLHLVLNRLTSREIENVCMSNKELYQRCQHPKIKQLLQEKKDEETKWYLYVDEPYYTLSFRPLNRPETVKVIRVDAPTVKPYKGYVSIAYFYKDTKDNIVSPILPTRIEQKKWLKEHNIKIGKDGYGINENFKFVNSD